MKDNAMYYESLKNGDEEVKHRMNDSIVIYKAYEQGQITREEMDRLLGRPEDTQ